MFWGTKLASKNHVMAVMDLWKKKSHGLLKVDANVKDKQNVLAIQRLAFSCVRAYLEELDSVTIWKGYFV